MTATTCSVQCIYNCLQRLHTIEERCQRRQPSICSRVRQRVDLLMGDVSCDDERIPLNRLNSTKCQSSVLRINQQQRLVELFTFFTSSVIRAKRRTRST